MKTLSLLIISNITLLCMLIYNATGRPAFSLPHLIPEDASNDLTRSIKEIYNSDLEQSRKYLDLGDQLLSEGYFSNASLCYQYSIQNDADDYPAHMGLAVCLEVLGHKAAAIKKFLHISSLSEDKEIANCCVIRAGILLLRSGKTTKAIKLFASTDDPAAYYYLCRIHAQQENQDKAKTYYSKLLDLDQDHLMAELYQLNALSLRKFGMPFSDIPDTNHRELLFSENVPLEIRKAIARFTSNSTPHKKYKSVLNKLPTLEHDTKHFTNDELVEYAHNKSAIKRGHELFKRSNCIICHGVNSGGFNGPNLTDDYWIVDPISASSIYNTILNGRANNTMPAHEHILHPEQIRDITAYVINTNLHSKKSDIGAAQFGKAPQGTFQPLSDIKSFKEK